MIIEAARKISKNQTVPDQKYDISSARIQHDKIFREHQEKEKQAFLPVVNAFYDSLVSIFKEAGKEESFEVCFPCGIPDHAVYLYFTKIKERVVLRIDNTGAGAKENHIRGEKRRLKKKGRHFSSIDRMFSTGSQ